MSKKGRNGNRPNLKGNFGMLSVKAGMDNNPGITYADKIAGAKKLREVSSQLKKASAMHKAQANKIDRMLKSMSKKKK
jgi:hypothetical protein